MLQPNFAKNFGRLGAFFLAIVIFVVLLALQRWHQARDYDRDSSASLPVSASQIQNAPKVANSAKATVLRPAGNNVIDSDKPNPTTTRSTSREGKDVRFAGNRSIPTARLEELTRSVQSVKSEDFSKELSSTIKSLYRALGFLKADVIVESDPNDPRKILIKLDEGAQYRWGDFKVNSEILEQKTVLSLFHVERGWPVNALDIPNLFSTYLNNLKEEGYLDCAYTPHVSIDDASAQVNLQLEISEGPRYVVRNVSFDNPKAQTLFAKLQGQFFSPSLYRSFLVQAGLTDKEVRLDFNSTRGEVSILGSLSKP